MYLTRPTSPKYSQEGANFASEVVHSRFLFTTTILPHLESMLQSKTVEWVRLLNLFSVAILYAFSVLKHLAAMFHFVLFLLKDNQRKKFVYVFCLEKAKLWFQLNHLLVTAKNFRFGKSSNRPWNQYFYSSPASSSWGQYFWPFGKSLRPYCDENKKPICWVHLFSLTKQVCPPQDFPSLNHRYKSYF